MLILTRQRLSDISYPPLYRLQSLTYTVSLSETYLDTQVWRSRIRPLHVNSSHLGSCTLRVSTFATIVDHSFLSSVIDSSRPYSIMSLLILSIHLMRGPPLGLSISSTVIVMSSGFLRFICPYQLSRRLVTWSTIGITFALFRISSLLTWSFKLIPWIQRSILVSVLFSSCSSFCLMAQHSAPYSMVGLITVCPGNLFWARATLLLCTHVGGRTWAILCYKYHAL